MKNPAGNGLADMRSAWNNQLKEVTDRAVLEPVGTPLTNGGMISTMYG